MTKPEAYPVDPPNAPRRTKNVDNNIPEPLSGSKKVKNKITLASATGKAPKFYRTIANA